MIANITRKQFESAIIAQDDDNDYSESGWLAVIIGGDAALAKYGHCSCYGTWESLNGGGISDHFEGEELRSPAWDWSGTPDDLVTLAKLNGDPFIPGRTSDPNDIDADHLAKVYAQIVAWDAAGRKTSTEAAHA